VSGQGGVMLDVRVDPALLDPRFPLARRELLPLMDTLFASLGLVGKSLSLTLLDDAGVAELNARHMGCQGPTNILSFPEGDTKRPKHLGALFLSVETLSREACLYGQSPCAHLARLLAHGMLHLAGHDHGPEMDSLTELAVDIVEGMNLCGGCGGSCDSDW
jgi:probable rRNA maturation factor